MTSSKSQTSKILWLFCETVTPQGNGTQHIAVPKIVISLVFVLGSPSLMCSGVVGHMRCMGFRSAFLPVLCKFCFAAHMSLLHACPLAWSTGVHWALFYVMSETLKLRSIVALIACSAHIHSQSARSNTQRHVRLGARPFGRAQSEWGHFCCRTLIWVGLVQW